MVGMLIKINFTFKKFNFCPYVINKLFPCLQQILLSADNFSKQFGPRSGRTKCGQDWEHIDLAWVCKQTTLI